MSEAPLDKLSLRDLAWPRFLRGPDPQLLENLYVPALQRAVRYDRCCAYFSSQVLAVAARGFGGFIQNLERLGEDAPRPAARLLVNEQMDPQDVEAMLATGDQTALADKLLRQLKTPRAALERNRLAMLAWLVARGLLEVRVGVMRQGGGIAHAKFGVVADAQGERLVFRGSGNETGQAILENYEEIELSTSWDDPGADAYYRERFRALWEGQDPYVAIYSLPEAVRQRLIQFAPSAPPVEIPCDVDALRCAMLWRYIAAAPYLPHGEAACDATAFVEPWPHQRRVVEDTAHAFPAGRLLCDEVGLGKTIEAILILRRLLCGRGVRRALLLVPAGLLQQWQEELREKGGLLVPYWDGRQLRYADGSRQTIEAPDALAREDVLLLSREWARLSGNRNLVLTAPTWDLVLLDEAHAARRSAGVEREFNSANLLLQLLRELQLRRRARGILLLSATPMQIHPWEPWDLLTTLGVGGRWMADFSDIRAFYDGVAALRSRGLSLTAARPIAHLVAGDEEFPPNPSIRNNSPDEIARGLAFCGFGEPRRACADWLRQGAPLGRRMHRNTRDTLRQYHRLGLLDQAPPRRELEDVVYDYGVQAERDCYEAITGYIDRRYEELEQERGGKGFVMTVYRRRAASSPHALRCSLARRLEKLERVIRRQSMDPWSVVEEEQLDERDLADADLEAIDPAVPSDPEVAARERQELRHLLQRLSDLGSTDSKLERFSGVLRQVLDDGRAALVFSEYTDTMDYLRDQLRPSFGKTLGCYSGDGGQMWDGQQWVHVGKAEITSALDRGELRVLVCTDAASEGLNLQAAGAVINYDLPWNPSKVEQRIGRVDRIGQRHAAVLVRNLFLRDSVDMRVYQVLQARCGLFTHFVGRMQPVLSVVRVAFRNNLTEREVDDLLAEIESAASAADSDAAMAEAFVESAAQECPATRPPVTLSDLEEALGWLQGARGAVRVQPGKQAGTWRLTGLKGGAVVASLDRQVLEADASVQPLTLGAPLVENLASALPKASRMPLVIGEYEQAPYRCVEMRWVARDEIRSIESARPLMGLIQAWEGEAPAPERLREAEEEARATARQRVEAMLSRARQVEVDALCRQVEAARRRLMRELGRTLRTQSHGDLNAAFRRAVEREKGSDGRYHRALRLLGGYPTWSAEEQADADAYERSVSNHDRVGRIAGSEIDAAIHDPRWLAKRVLAEDDQGGTTRSGR